MNKDKIFSFILNKLSIFGNLFRYKYKEVKKGRYI